ncbi:MliC family protein [Roseobacter sp. N2S]|uniref:MliC family protein n=1 Tax=Roseobacter sp. N2S TaxID=2663844 RepID=UPI00285C8B63|nr:MliC family protein [Roseobacter sp. N2S]MDR6265645.1 uncharacterized protein [Roseobacter sp. N2S]
MIRYFLLGFLAFTTPALAQNGPSFDCAAAETTAEKLICQDPELAALDQLVADRYKAAITVIRGLDSGAKSAEEALHSYQRGWIGGRDDCWKTDDPRDCVAWNYKRREGQLVAQYLLETPSSTATWHCGDSPANEVETQFFDTAMPSVRIERGDRVTVGALTPAASGARYDADFGQFIWIKGDEAHYREPDPDGQDFSCKIVK